MSGLSSLIKRIMRFYDDQDTIEEKVFWCVVPLTFIAGIVSVIGTLTEGLGTLAVASGVACLFAPLFFGILCYKTEDCRKYYFWYCLVLNCVLIPLTFLSNGGLVSGMPLYCLSTLMFCAFCSRMRDRCISFAVSLVVFVAVFILSVKFPQIVVPVREDFIRTDIILTFVLAAVGITFIISKVIEEYNTQRYKEMSNGLIDSLGSIIEFRSLETGNHGHNIKRITEILLKTANSTIKGANFSQHDISMISSAAVLHDIGKIAVPDVVLNKPGKLTSDEYDIIKHHPLDGCKMLESMREYQNPTYYEYCYEICRHHHERYDGTGYPDGLKGDEISLIAQITSVADVFEALISNRVYKSAFTLFDAYDIITEGSHGQWSEEVIGCFKAAWTELVKYVNEERKD